MPDNDCRKFGARSWPGIGILQHAMTQATGLLDLPFEVLAGILINLSPDDLGSIRLVNKRLNDVLEQDSSWRVAFRNYFGVRDGDAVFASRLTTKSWMKEFYARVKLLSSWSKARTPTMTTDAHIGPVDTILPPLTSSTTGRLETLNVLVRSEHHYARVLPFLGQLVKPTHALGDAQQPLGSVVSDRDTIVWGASNGIIAYKRAGMPSNRNERAWAMQRRLQWIGSAHQSRITAITTCTRLDAAIGEEAEHIASICADGRLCVHVLNGDDTSRRASSIVLPLDLIGEAPEEATSIAAMGIPSCSEEGSDSPTPLFLVGTTKGRVFVVSPDSGTIQSTLIVSDTSVASITPDDSTSSALLRSDRCSHMYKLDLRTLEVHTMSAASDRLVALTAFAHSFALPTVPTDNYENVENDGFGTSFVAAGDEDGNVYIWNWQSEQSLPVRSLKASRFAVSALAWNDACLFVGCVDGSYRVFDILSFTMIRLFKGHSSKLSTTSLLTSTRSPRETRKWAVNSLVASNDTVLAAVGNRLLAWHTGSARKVATPNKKSKRPKPRFETHDDLEDGLSAMRLERTEQASRLQAEHDRNKRFGLSKDLRSLSEEEAVSLALMMSRDEYEGTTGPASGDVSADTSHEGSSIDLRQMQDSDADLKYALELSLAEAKSLEQT